MADHNNTASPDLPDLVVNHDGKREGESRAIAPKPSRWRLLRLLAIPALLFLGAVIGLYFQPPGLQKFFQLTGLQPGAGTDVPIALPPEISLPDDVMQTLQITDVIGLARLMPQGDISTVAPPYGAGDARIAQVLVAQGDRVDAGDVVARLDNGAQLQSAVMSAEATVAVRAASMLQTRQGVQISTDEARASFEQAEIAALEARSELTRTQELFERGVTTQAVLDMTQSTSSQADRAVDRARATLARYESADTDAQPDVLVAARNLDAARSELDRARRDLARAEVVAPIDGVILDIHARAGEKPPADGILTMGETKVMMAEVEVYQDRIAMVELDQPVELLAEAIQRTLSGRVVDIGLTVGRQSVVSDETAANTDARVVTVLVELDADSSVIAARYTNLEVIARIDTRAAP